MNLIELKLYHRRNIMTAFAAIAVVFCLNVFGKTSDEQTNFHSQPKLEHERLKPQNGNFKPKSDKNEGIEIKIIRIEPKLDKGNKLTGILSRKEVLQEVFVPFDEDNPNETVLTKTLNQELPKNDYFVFEVTNKSAREIYLNTNLINPSEKCPSQDRNLRSLGFNMSTLSGFKTVDEGEVIKFIVLAAFNSKQLEDIFMAVDYLAGIPTGRSEVNLKAIDAEVKQGYAKGKGEFLSSSNQKITITLGNVYGKNGERLRSAEFYEALLNISVCSFKEEQTRPQAKLQELKIGWLNNKALANYQTGNLEQSKADYLKALEILNQFEDYEFSAKYLVRAIIQTNLGLVYATLNDHKTAISNYEAAQKIIETELSGVKENERKQRLSAVFNGLGTSFESLGDFEKANDNYTKALDAEREIGDKAGEGITLNSLARLMAKKGKYEDAEKMYRQAIALSTETENQAGIGSASNNLGLLLLRLPNKIDEARQAFLAANFIFKKLKNRTAQATALSNLMFVEQKANQMQTAIVYGKQAVNVLQSVRKDISNIEVQLQKSFLLSRQQTYRNLTDLLISEKRFAEAQIILGLLKEEEYSQLSRSDDKKETIPYSQAEDDLIVIVESLASLVKRREELAKLDNNGKLSTAEDKEFSEIDKKIEEANAGFNKSLESLKKSEPTVKEMLEKIEKQTNITNMLAKMKTETGENAVAIYTVIGTEDVRDEKGEAKTKKSKFGWMVLVTEKTSKAYPIDVEDLEKTVFEFRTALSSEKYDPQPLAKILYNKLFRHISEKQKVTLEADLQKTFGNDKAPTIMWSLDSVLRYVPMAALHDGGQYLAKKYRQIVFTDQSLLGLSEKDSDWQILGLGVSDEKIVNNQKFSALPGVTTELNKIICQTNETDCFFKGIRKLNEDFTKEETIKLWTRNDGKYSVIHISSHFSFNPVQKDSFLLMGDGAMKFGDIENIRGLFNKVDLITLSACDTAMSNNGLESESFAWLVQKLGAKTVLASLWQVSDAVTPELMIHFYKIRAENPQMSKGEAFRQAQLSLLGDMENRKPSGSSAKIRSDKIILDNSEIELPLFVKDAKKPFAHPHYWASFVMIGNWK